MHVMILPSWYPTYAAPLNGIFFREQAEAMVRHQGFTVGVIAPCPRSLATLRAGGLSMGVERAVENGLDVWRDHYLRLPKMHRLERNRWLSSARRLFARYVADKGRPDLIHAHCAVWGGFAASILSRRDGIPYVLTEHSTGFARGLYEGWYRPAIRQAFAQASGVMCVSSPLRRLVSSYRPQADIVVLPNFIDTDLFAPSRQEPPSDRFRFVCIAHFHAKKAIDLLIDAFAMAFPRESPVMLTLIGDGPERPKIEGLIRSRGLGDRVLLLGACDRRQVRDELQRSHCCVSSSHVETFGVTLIEALATGIPIVATRSGGPEDIVREDNGHLVAVGDARQLADAMRSVYERRGMWRERHTAIREDAVRRFGAAAVAERLGRIYRSHARKG